MGYSLQPHHTAHTFVSGKCQLKKNNSSYLNILLVCCLLVPVIVMQFFNCKKPKSLVQSDSSNHVLTISSGDHTSTLGSTFFLFFNASSKGTSALGLLLFSLLQQLNATVRLRQQTRYLSIYSLGYRYGKNFTGTKVMYSSCFLQYFTGF